MRNKNLTPHDKEILDLMPDDRWFQASELPYPRVKRADYRCDRLKNLGFIECRVTGSYPLIHTEHRKLSKVQQQAA